MCVCYFQFTIRGNWKSSKRHGSSYSDLFLVFSVQTKPPKKPLHLIVSSSEQKKNISTYWLFQVEVFEAIQHILTSRARWKIPKRVDVLNTSQAGIKYKCWNQKRAIFVKAWDALHDWTKVKFTWNGQNTIRFLENVKIVQLECEVFRVSVRQGEIWYLQEPNKC